MRACYQDARFILVATVSGITQAPEGSAHQSVGEPLTGLAQPGLTSFEPAYADELAVLLRWAFEEIQRETGESVQLRRTIDPDLAEAIVAGLIGCASRRQVPSLQSPIVVPSPRRRSPPVRR